MADVRDRLDEAIAAGQVDGLHGLVVVHDGQTVFEHYGKGPDFAWARPIGVVEFGPDTLHDLRSVTKSVTALGYGIALGAGLVPGPDEPLLAHFPQYPDLAAQPERARLTVGHALTMSLGLEWREEIPYDGPHNAEVAMEFAEDRYRFVLSRPVAGPPGERWTYCGGASALLGGLIAAGTGKTLAQYAQEALFTPLGIGAFEWTAGPDGVPSAASGLRLTPRDLARIGEAVLADGGGVVPADWLAAALEPRLTTDWGAGYGYQWYVEHIAGRDIVAAQGNGGQRLFVVRDLGLVVAVTAGNYDHPEQWRTPMAALEQVVLPAFAA